MIRVYVAGKTHHYKKFKELRKVWAKEGLNIHSRWLDQANLEVEPKGNEALTDGDYSIFWLVDEEDVKESDVLIVYAEPGDILRGALIEAGIAIAMGILVIVVGDSPYYGTWYHHPLVVQASSMDHAKQIILHRFRSKPCEPHSSE